MDEKSSIRILGSGTIGSGAYASVHISGSGKATGNITAEGVHVSGSGQFKDLEAEELHISGSAAIDGTFKCGSAHISGSMHIAKDAQIDEMRISGSCRIQGQVKAKSLTASGSLTADQDVECEDMNISGGVHIRGLLNVETLLIRLGGTSEINEIGGETIQVKRSGNAPNLLTRIFSANRCFRLSCKSIEGTDIYLENTDADVVRGKTIEIGPGCRIGLIEYTDSLSDSPDSAIQKSVKIS